MVRGDTNQGGGEALYTPKNWDPTDKEYDPIFGITTLDKVIESWDSFKVKAASFLQKSGKAAKLARFIPKVGEFLQKCILFFIDLFAGIINFIDAIVKILKKVSNIIHVVNAFLCGVLNGVTDFVAGMIDLVALLFELKDPVKSDTLKEQIENIIEDYKKYPLKLFKDLNDFFDKLENRYSDDKSGCEKAYNAGKDIVTVALIVDGVIGIIKIIRTLGKGLEEVSEWFGKSVAKDEAAIIEAGALMGNPKFIKIVDDLRTGRVARAFEDILTLTEEAALRYYTTVDGYKLFNKALRGEIPMTKEFAAQRNLMNKALDKLPISEYNSSEKLLYRIENLTEKQIDEIYKVGEIITKNDFTSATYSEEALINAMEHRNYSILVRIEGKSGRLIEALSTFEAEKEILFKAGSKFYVKSIGLSNNPSDFASPIKTIILIEK